jgi:Putative polyhydroxyalkanoic acid system protein (PHA_gran_rgn)
MQIDYKHKCEDAEVRPRLEKLSSYLHNRHGIKIEWNGTKAKFSGKYLVVKIDGELAIGANIVTFRGEDPGFLWRKKASEYIAEKLETYLDPTTPLDALPTAG